MPKKITPYKKKFPKHSSREVDTIQNEINQIFEQHLAPFLPHEKEPSFLEPSIEINETNSAVTVSAELPGMSADDIEVNVSVDGYLTISGEKQHEEKTEEKNGYYFSERSYGMIQRTIAIPTDIDFEKTSADFKHGVLTVRIPKTESAKLKTKKINVESK